MGGTQHTHTGPPSPEPWTMTDSPGSTGPDVQLITPLSCSVSPSTVTPSIMSSAIVWEKLN